MRSQIENFCKEYEYPAEATASLLADFDKIMASEYALMFKRHVDLYNSDDPVFSYDAVLSASKHHICKNMSVKLRTASPLSMTAVSFQCP